MRSELVPESGSPPITLVGLKGRVCVVTGAAQGIGYAVAQALARRGAAVALFDIQRERCEAAADAITREFNVPARAYCIDIKDESSLEQATRTAEADLGHLYGLAACAGITTGPASGEAISRIDWNNMLDVNLTGTFLTCQVVGRRLVERREGTVVTISSTLGMSVQAGRAAYCTSKWGLIGLSQTLAVDWAERGVRVNIVVPQATETAMARQNLSPIIDHVILPRTPLRRLGRPEDIGNAVAFLMSDEASYITGAILRVDGGISTGFYHQ